MEAEEIAVIIPALDEEEPLPLVLADLSEIGLLSRTVVVDNGSRDGTARVAAQAGASVVAEPRRGYGAACLRGIEEAERSLPGASILVFLDADRSDDPFLIPRLVAPIAEGRCDLVIGSRPAGRPEPGALLPHQRAGNLLICSLIRLLYGHRYTDLGPFRAIRREALRSLGMRDAGFGWTVEMQVRALLRGLRVIEVPVSYRPRVGVSKISGTLAGSTLAALKIGWTVAALRIRGA